MSLLGCCGGLLGCIAEEQLNRASVWATLWLCGPPHQCALLSRVLNDSAHVCLWLTDSVLSAEAPKHADKLSSKAEEQAQKAADKAKPMAEDASKKVEGTAEDVAGKAQPAAEDASKKLHGKAK